MAKRRNLKKEKAQRNQAYARKFRKSKRNTGRFSKNRRYGSKPPKSEETTAETNNEDNYQGGTGAM
ncbi:MULTISPECIES: hypothetical protein [Moorena]|uniref:Uncharacterized protein n=1 Tax=Moorena producens 3L TaxID=489825 RepID=F4XWR2_9CYAN|nr:MULTISPECIES: hypothetical protein [Moorena]NES85247.1 hypothetical protein [Moorena sp. SIO2B7]EGJ31022.1 hypothetical protein LYNGBM3L_44450 [Moorena producens 3L]NEP31932.1 hypothetical protein [Moorena sp. SIO3B2]NEP66066.1 hypothetical protein [Moorena sp. SIO3A5]NEQ08200.1 hypothetical protein [Moorena sp. SIO4E2]